MPDFYDNLRKQGLSHLVPSSHKQTSRSYSPASPVPRRRYAPSTPNRSYGFDRERYEKAVPPEFRYGHSFQLAHQPMSQTQHRQLDNYAYSVFSRMEQVLEDAYAAGHAGRKPWE
jgi:hypothetical protein